MTARILKTWAQAEQQRRAQNRLLATCAVVLIAAVAGYAWGMI